MIDETAKTEGTILVPIANTETAERQLDIAIDLAIDQSYEIVLLYVLSVPSQLSLKDGHQYLLKDENEQLLADAAERVECHGVPVDTRIRIARGIATGIVGAVDAYEADTVLLGWRGRPPRGDVVLGSHLDTVLRNATCDVLVKRIKTPTDDVNSALVPVAGGPHDSFSAETAAAIARRHDASVTLLYVLESDDPEMSRPEAEALLGETAGTFDSAQSISRELVKSDNVAGTITDRTATHDITVLGVSRGGIVQRRLLGTISEAVGRHASGTVILSKRYDPVPSRLKRLLS
ncbi:universal stress protein [Halostagnicola bangensis]